MTAFRLFIAGEICGLEWLFAALRYSAVGQKLPFATAQVFRISDQLCESSRWDFFDLNDCYSCCRQRLG